TEYGHTRTQSSLPSHRLRSMTGAITPASCRHSVEVSMAAEHTWVSRPTPCSGVAATPWRDCSARYAELSAAPSKSRGFAALSLRHGPCVSSSRHEPGGHDGWLADGSGGAVVRDRRPVPRSAARGGAQHVRGGSPDRRNDPLVPLTVQR